MRIIKVLISFALISFCALHCYAQENLESLVNRLKTFGEKIPQEQIFLHLDNSSYYLNDTIFYKAYVRRTDNGKPSNLSGILYCELLNNDGYLVERQMITLDKGEGHGNFCLTDTTLYAGYYEIRAYTRWQLNWGITEQPHSKWADDYFFNKQMVKDYYRDYEKLYSRVFPVYNKPLSPGDYTPEMTLRPLAAYYKNPNENPHTTIQFFPEGGNLVEGVKQRIAWEVRNEIGMALEGTLCVHLTNGDSIVSQTMNRGRGVFEITPVAGQEPKATFTPKKNSTNPANTQSATKQLPAPTKDGVALRVNTDTLGINILYATPKTVLNDTLGLTIMQNGILKHFRELNGDTIQFLANEPGVYQITIFNPEGKVYADRLCFFLPARFNHNNVSFNGIKENNYKAFEPISFEIKGEPGSSLSVAVRDAAKSEYIYDTGSMLTEALLSSQIKGFVPHPQWFFESDNAERRLALDLLMMVQGWRKYSWKVMALPQQFVLRHMPEGRYPRWSGQVHNYSAEQVLSIYEQQAQTTQHQGAEDGGEIEEQEEEYKEQAEESREQDSRDRFNKKENNLKHPVVVHAEFSQPGNQGVTGEMFSQGEFSIDFPRYYEEFFFFLAASDSTKWKKGVPPIWTQTGRSKHDEIEFPEFYVKLDPIYPRFVKPYDYYQSHIAPMPKSYPLYNAQDEYVRMLSEVTIGARRNGRRRFGHWRPAFIIDAYEAFNATCDAGFTPGYFMGSSRFGEDIARTYIGDMKMDRKYEINYRFDGKILIDRNSSSQGKRKTDIPNAMPESISNISDNKLDKYNYLWNLSDVIVYTDYSPRNDKHNKYKGNEIPSVTVDLILLKDGEERSYQKNRRWKMKGFSIADEFYSPDYSKTPLPQHDFRRTLYWNPSIRLDENGKAQITLYNNSSTSLLQIQAEGWTKEGAPQSGKVN
ncbi:MAG: hypothetical protein IKU79_02970 [Bacteroidaceae bacterium]|nr:hypothetical protein [Bacteroidaceae bacterium]